MSRGIDRRDFLKAAGVTAAASLAGCTGGFDGDVTYADWNQPRYDALNTAYNPNAKVPTENLTRGWGFDRPTADEPGDVIAPAVANGRVYLPDGSQLVAVESDGDGVVWEYTFPERVSASPTVVGNNVYVTAGRTLYQLFEDGGGWSGATSVALGWNARQPTAIASGVTVANGVAYVQLADGTPVAVEAATGERRWIHPDWSLGDAEPATPTVGAELCLPSAEGVGVVRDLSDLDSPSDTDLTDSTQLITVATGSGRGVPTSPVVRRSMTGYYVDRAGTLVAVNLSPANDDRAEWQQPVDAIGTPALYNDKLFVATERGVEAFGTGDGVRPDEWNGPFTPPSGARCFAPSVTGGVVYVAAEDGRLYAFSTATGEPLAEYGDRVAASGDVVLAGTRVFAHGVGDRPATTTTTSQSETTTSETTGVGAGATEPRHRQLYSVVGDDSRAQLDSLRVEKLATADAVDELSLPIEVNGLDVNSLLADRKRAESSLDVLLGKVDGGEVSVRTGRDTIERMRWSEQVTKRTLELAGPTTDKPERAVQSFRDLEFGDFLAYDTGKMTFRFLIEVALMFIPIKGVGKAMKSAGKWLDDGAKAVGKRLPDVGKVTDDVSVGFKPTGKLKRGKEAGEELVAGFRDEIGDEWAALKEAGLKQASDWKEYVSSRAVDTTNQLVKELTDSMLAQAVDDIPALRNLWNHELADGLRFVWGLFSQGKDWTVKTLVEAYWRAGREWNSLTDDVYAVGGQARTTAADLGDDAKKLYDDAAERARARTEQVREVRERYKHVEAQVFGPVRKLGEYGDNIVKALLTELMKREDDTKPLEDAAEALENDEVQTVVETLDRYESEIESWFGERDVLKWAMEGFIENASKTFAFAYTEMLERGNLGYASGPLAAGLNTQAKKITIRDTMERSESQLRNNYDRLGRTDGLPGQNESREAYNRALEDLDHTAREVITPLVKIGSGAFDEALALLDETENRMKHAVLSRNVPPRVVASFETVLDVDLPDEPTVRELVGALTPDHIDSLVSDLLAKYGEASTALKEGLSNLSNGSVKTLFEVAKWLLLALTSIVFVFSGAAFGWSGLRMLQIDHLEGTKGIVHGNPNYSLTTDGI